MSSFNVQSFLENYQQYPCLWDKSLPEFKDREKRNRAQSELLKLTNLENIKALRAKIRAVRGTFNNELRKIRQSMNMGCGSLEVYKPKLKWFEYAQTFLGTNQETEQQSETNLDIENSKEEDEHLSEDLDECYLPDIEIKVIENKSTRGLGKSIPSSSSLSSHSSSIEPIKRQKQDQVQNIRGRKKIKRNPLHEALDTLNEVRESIIQNEFILFGQLVGVQLNKLSLPKALELQLKIQQMLTEARLTEVQTLSAKSALWFTSMQPSTSTVLEEPPLTTTMMSSPHSNTRLFKRRHSCDI